MAGQPGYSAEPILIDGKLADVRVLRDGRAQHLGGKRAVANEVQRVAALADGSLPVFLGSGLGAGIREFLATHSGPIAVVDKEQPICRVTGLRDALAQEDRIFWISEEDPEAALTALTRWQLRNDGKPFTPVLDPFYARLDPEYYRGLFDRLSASREIDFWAKSRYPKFLSSVPRILLLTSSYFLMGELEAACRRLGYATCFVQLPSQEIGSQEFVERILTEILAFRPDFVLTINHLGVDKEGILTSLLAQMQLPLASWFVDNPHLILYIYENLASDWVTLFTWDADNLESLRKQGFSRVHYLPLATDPHRFAHVCGQSFQRDVAFVGNSMVHKVRAKLEKYAFPRKLVVEFEKIAQAFMQSGELSVGPFLEKRYPDAFVLFRQLPDVDTRLAYETLITWQATLDYRLERVRKLLPFEPHVVGDKGWFELLPETEWRYHRELNYYEDLPRFYPSTKVNFNCTSQQMKGAVNQRVFDVPVCGGFLLTDHRWQMEHLLEPGKEIICYGTPDEIGALVSYYLRHESDRRRIIDAGRARILAEHTYDVRLAELTEIMRRAYS